MFKATACDRFSEDVSRVILRAPVPQLDVAALHGLSDKVVPDGYVLSTRVERIVVREVHGSFVVTVQADSVSSEIGMDEVGQERYLTEYGWTWRQVAPLLSEYKQNVSIAFLGTGVLDLTVGGSAS